MKSSKLHSENTYLSIENIKYKSRQEISSCCQITSVVWFCKCVSIRALNILSTCAQGKIYLRSKCPSCLWCWFFRNFEINSDWLNRIYWNYLRSIESNLKSISIKNWLWKISFGSIDQFSADQLTFLRFNSQFCISVLRVPMINLVSNFFSNAILSYTRKSNW